MQEELSFDHPPAASEALFGELQKEALAQKKRWAGDLAPFVGQKVVVRLKYHREAIEGKFEVLGPGEFSVNHQSFDRALLAELPTLA